MVEYFAGTAIGVVSVYLILWMVRPAFEFTGATAITIVASTIVAGVVAVVLVTLLVSSPTVDILNGVITGICVGVVSRVAGSYGRR